MIKLSVLIPTIVGRESQYDSLINKLSSQYNGGEIEICTEKDNRETPIGAKRNKLLETASGKYLTFIDDDNGISDNYIALLLKAIESDCDCASLKGIITTNGGNPEIFEHSMKYGQWRTTTNEIKYERGINHLNLVRASIAKQFKFPEINHGEDHNWATQLQNSGLLKTEYYIDEILYFYNYRTTK